jgi:Cdc6-like AAA superfamily ATPase
MKRIAGIFVLLSLFSFAKAQELKCNVQVVSQQIQGTNKQVFETLQNAIYEFMNNKAWTNHVFGTEERIECNLMFNITEQLSADEFKGTLDIKYSRIVFNTNYNTNMLSYLDNDIQFKYIEFEPLEFDPSSHISNLTSILAYYSYIILGLDYDSFGLDGGTPYFQAAEKIVDNAQNAPEKGWKPFDNTSHKNRYWLVKDILDPDYAPLREFIYKYHRQGLDLMDSKVVEARASIATDLELLQGVYRKKPDPFMHPMHVLYDAKADEFVKIFSESFPEERSRVIAILNEIDQANSSKYKAIADAKK